jgi:hypothetical protein
MPVCFLAIDPILKFKVVLPYFVAESTYINKRLPEYWWHTSNNPAGFQTARILSRTDWNCEGAGAGRGFLEAEEGGLLFAWEEAVDNTGRALCNFRIRKELSKDLKGSAGTIVEKTCSLRYTSSDSNTNLLEGIFLQFPVYAFINSICKNFLIMFGTERKR